MQALTDDEIQRRVAALRAGELHAHSADALKSGGLHNPATRASAVGGSASFPPAATPRTFVKPLLAAADSLIDALGIEDGIGLGLGQIDVLTRGFRPTDFVIITGFAHSGKTQIVNTMIVENPNKHVLFFSLDDPAEMILAKLVAMDSNIPSEQLEQRVRAGDEETKRLIRSAAEKRFANLLVVDEVIGINAMHQAVKEATELWGRKPDAVVIDYLEMMPGSGTNDDESANVKHKANALKGWAKHAEYPIIALHQGTRSRATPGDPITLLSMGYSGEQQATIVLGCRRKRDRSDLEPYDRQAHENTITVHVVKNKRPGGRCTHFDGIDFYMEPSTGLIRPLDHVEALVAANPHSAAARKVVIERDVVSAQEQLGATVVGEEEPF